MDWPSRCSTMEGLTRPGAREGFSAELAPKVTLALSTGVWQAPLCSRSMKRFRPLSPLSNSWLPNVMASKQTVFIMAASASPGSPARLKYRVPVVASPACSLSTLGEAAESALMAPVTRAKPPASALTVTVAPAAFLSEVLLLAVQVGVMIVDVQDRQLHRPGGHGRRGGRVGAGLSSSSSLPPQAATSAIIPSIVARAMPLPVLLPVHSLSRVVGLGTANDRGGR